VRPPATLQATDRGIDRSDPVTPVSSSPSRPEPAGALAATASPPSVTAGHPATASAAGNDETIPRVFLALADIGTLGFAFVVTGLMAPWVQWLLLPSGPMGVSLPAWMSLPATPGFDQFPRLTSVAWVLIATSPIAVFFMELLGGYRQLVDQSRARLLISSVLSPLIALSFLTLAFFALKTSSSSRVFVFTFGLVSVVALLTYRSILRGYKRHRLGSGVYAKNVLLIGRAAAVRWMAQHFRQHVPSNRYQLAGWATLGPMDELDHVDLGRLGAVEDLGGLLINSPIHEVIAVQSSGQRDWLRQVIEDCDYFRVRLRIVPEALLVGNLRDLKLVFRSGPLRLPEVVLAPPHLETDALFLKRLIDIVASAILLILLAPLFLLVAIAIKVTTPDLDVFYPWRVIGLKGRPFVGYKFTTMVADADERKKDLLDQNEMSGPVFKIKNDPRITPLGRFLRKYSLNELPQLWSVLKGDMSLVGPRPAGPHELARYELWHKRKLCVQPGVTCLWQVSGRNRISDFDEWVRLDLEYIDKWSLWLDLRILARTAFAVLGGTGS
jgi:exopolysaccharide biosynthesis polyprenyl glycosylphosphotransferase